METSLTQEELLRYSRHFNLPEFGTEGQIKLKQSKVLVVGAGGLGAPVLLYLAAAGVGEIGIVDDDVVEASNLQRQVMYNTEDIGKSKAEQSAARIAQLNPNVQLTVYRTRLVKENIMEMVAPYDLVVDGTDNFPTRYLTNDACVLLKKPYIYGSIFRFEGQVSVFNQTNGGEIGPNYRDIFPEAPPASAVPNCAEGGVLGVLPGIIGSMQASEAIKVLTGIGSSLSGKLFIFDALSFSTHTIKIKKTGIAIEALGDYEENCDITINETNTMKEVTVQELKALMDEGTDFQLIDVREQHEFDLANIAGELIPMGDIEQNIDKISKDKQVVVHCRSGARSGNVINYLNQKHGFDNLYNLKGGILAWSDEIDSSVQKY